MKRIMVVGGSHDGSLIMASRHIKTVRMARREALDPESFLNDPRPYKAAYDVYTRDEDGDFVFTHTLRE